MALQSKSNHLAWGHFWEKVEIASAWNCLNVFIIIKKNKSNKNNTTSNRSRTSQHKQEPEWKVPWIINTWLSLTCWFNRLSWNIRKVFFSANFKPASAKQSEPSEWQKQMKRMSRLQSGFHWVEFPHRWRRNYGQRYAKMQIDYVMRRSRWKSSQTSTEEITY